LCDSGQIVPGRIKIQLYDMRFTKGDNR
jgi:hypothetical protein